MSKTMPDSCDICQEVWNRNNLIPLDISDSQRLLICPHCHKNIKNFISNIKAKELNNIKTDIENLSVRVDTDSDNGDEYEYLERDEVLQVLYEHIKGNKQ